MSDRSHRDQARDDAQGESFDEAQRTRLFDLLYEDLRERAAVRFRHERAGHTLQPTALVNEAWLKLSENGEVAAHDRAHLLALASQAMRRVLVDHARGRGRLRRGGDRKREEISAIAAPDSGDALDLEQLDRALTRLQERSERLARIVEMRFFGGLSREETAEALGVSRTTAARDWRAAKAFLSNELRLAQEAGG